MSSPGYEYKSPKVKTLRVRLWKDVIRGIREPKFVDASVATHPSDDDWVVGVEGKSETKAYPIKVLAWRHIVNDFLDGSPIAVTYSSLCRSVVIFESEKPAGRHIFGVAGLNIAASNLVMYDDETLSLWNQLMGECLWGKLYSNFLKRIPYLILKWREWKKLFPKSKVLSTDLGLTYDYASYPTATMVGEFVESWDEYERSEKVPNAVPNLDRRFHPKAKLIALPLDEAVKVYPYSECEKLGAVNDVVEKQPVAILFSPESHVPAAYFRQLEGRELRFVARGSRVYDEETGSFWNIAGEAYEGGLKGRRLARLPAIHSLWFGWWVTYPNSAVYSAR